MADLGTQILNDMISYTDGVVKRGETDAKDIQRQMVTMAENTSPVRKYSTHTQTVRRIVVHRNPPSVPRAIREVKEEKYQPGYFRAGWTTGVIRLKNGTKLYGARNKHMPTVTHLINFDHTLITHGAHRGSVDGSGFVDSVQEWGSEELDRRLSEYLERK